MAITTHYATIGLVRVDQNGKVYSASDPHKTVSQMLRFTTEHRVFEDSTIPNTADYPNIKEYLEKEAVSGFETVQVGQTFVITVRKA